MNSQLNIKSFFFFFTSNALHQKDRYVSLTRAQIAWGFDMGRISHRGGYYTAHNQHSSVFKLVVGGRGSQLYTLFLFFFLAPLGGGATHYRPGTKCNQDG